MAGQNISRTWRLLRNLGLLAATGALAMLNWQIWTTPSDLRPIALESAARPGLVIANGALTETGGRNRASSYTQTLARPIFRADRKPFVAEVTPPPAPPPPDANPAQTETETSTTQLPEGLQLVGTMRDEEGRDRALVKSAQSPASSWLGIGDEIDGWRISVIEKSAVTLSAETSSIKLDLYPGSVRKDESGVP